MNVYLPDFRDQEKNTLYFIGNGFDLYHGLKTRYSDFREWLIKYNYTDFVSVMENVFPALKNGEYLLWKDFERALECANLMQVHHNFFQGIDDGWYDTDVQNRVVNRIKQYINKVSDLLRQWLTSVSIDSVPKLLDLSPDSLYLSFNYTLLLEKVYNIPADHILHIHNSINVKEPLITGHTFIYDEDGITTPNVNVEKSTQQIAVKLNGLRKPVHNIIKENRRYFDSLRNISQIVVFGHSLSYIDRLYFTEVFCNVKDNAKWYFVVINEKAKSDIKKLVCGYNESVNKQIGGYRYNKKMIIDNCKFLDIVNSNKNVQL